MALVRCRSCGDVWITIRWLNYTGPVKCPKCGAAMMVKLQEGELKSCELVKSPGEKRPLPWWGV